MNEQTWIDRDLGPRVVGGTYRCSYWNETYTVEAIWRAPDASQWAMRVRWSDGHTTIHSTAWDAKQDSVVKTATVPERAPEGTTKTQRLEAIVQGILCNSEDAPCTCHCHLETARCHECAISMRVGNAIADPPVPDRAPAGMLAVRVGSDPWTMVPLDNE